jgi:glycosyltransferase involved in cell wall biosynthesis
MSWDAAEGISRTDPPVSVLLATTGRPDMAEAFTRSLIETTVGHQVELVVAVDADEVTPRRIVNVPRHDNFTVVMDYRDEHRGCSRAWNDALRRSKGDPVVLAADDLEFQPGWLEAAKTRLSEFKGGWGFVGFNDGHWREELSTHYMMSRRLIREVFGGVVAWEHYHHSFNDREANARAQAAGRYAWCEEARVYHHHWIFGDRQQDETDSRLLPHHAASQQNFDLRAAAGFPNDYDPVIS